MIEQEGVIERKGVIKCSLTNKNVSISYLIVITKFVFFKISNSPPLFQKIAEPQFYQLRSPLNPEQPYQSFYKEASSLHIINITRQKLNCHYSKKNFLFGLMNNNISEISFSVSFAF